jgi:hypothetical protein
MLRRTAPGNNYAGSFAVHADVKEVEFKASQTNKHVRFGICSNKECGETFEGNCFVGMFPSGRLWAPSMGGDSTYTAETIFKASLRGDVVTFQKDGKEFGKCKINPGAEAWAKFWIYEQGSGATLTKLVNGKREKMAQAVVVKFGKSTKNEICTTKAADVKCHEGAGNKDSRLKDTKYGDSFKIFEKSSTEVCAKRTDSKAGWGLNLQVVCMQGASAEVVKIGKGKDNVACTSKAPDVQCDEGAGNSQKRLHGGHHGDTFKIFEKSPTEICAKRTDSKGGWGLNLEIVCDKGV